MYKTVWKTTDSKSAPAKTESYHDIELLFYYFYYYLFIIIIIILAVQDILRLPSQNHRF